MQTRRFVPGALNHIFFMSRDGGVLFYLTSDRLFFYSLLAVIARRYNVVVVGVCIMFTHVHLMVRAEDLAQLQAFMGQLLKALSTVFQKDRDLEGPVLKTPFGSAPRVASKQQRSSLIYLFNNSVEKHLCQRAEEDRWTFLAFYDGTVSPFSAPLVKRNASRRLRNACAVVDAESAAGRYLRPALLRRLSSGLRREELEQLCDYVIVKYPCIDYRLAVELFDGFERMLRTAEATTGKEFDIGEEFSPESRAQWIRKFRSATHATDRQIGKFLHLAEL